MSESNRHTDIDETVSSLAALIQRTHMSLMEAGEPDLADRAHIVIWRDGRVSMRFEDLDPDTVGHPTIEKALSIDPEFEVGPRLSASTPEKEG